LTVKYYFDIISNLEIENSENSFDNDGMFYLLMMLTTVGIGSVIEFLMSSIITIKKNNNNNNNNIRTFDTIINRKFRGFLPESYIHIRNIYIALLIITIIEKYLVTSLYYYTQIKKNFSFYLAYGISFISYLAVIISLYVFIKRINLNNKIKDKRKEEIRISVSSLKTIGVDIPQRKYNNDLFYPYPMMRKHRSNPEFDSPSTSYINDLDLRTPSKEPADLRSASNSSLGTTLRSLSWEDNIGNPKDEEIIQTKDDDSIIARGDISSDRTTPMKIEELM